MNLKINAVVNTEEIFRLADENGWLFEYSLQHYG